MKEKHSNALRHDAISASHVSEPDWQPSGFVVVQASHRQMIAGALGPVLLGLGSGVSISAGFGSFGFSVFLDGVNQTAHVPLWLSQVIMTMIFFYIAWVWARIPLGLGTVTALCLVGPAISAGATLTPISTVFTVHLLAFPVGLFLFSFGISLSAAAALGPDGVTALSLAAEKKQNWPVANSNLVWNLSAILIGTTLGGNVGPATFIGLLVTPIVIHHTLPWLRQHME